MLHYRQPMPVLPEQGYTKLDVNMRKHRMAELVSISLQRYCFLVSFSQNSILYEARHLLQAHGISPDIEPNLNECEDYLHRLLNLCVEVRQVTIWCVNDYNQSRSLRTAYQMW